MTTTYSPKLLAQPPHATELEVVVLGALLLERDALPGVMAILQPNHFYVPAHAEVFRAMQGLFAIGRPIDLLTLREQLIKTNRLQAAGGEALLIGLTNHVTSGAHAEEHALLVREKFVLRQLLQMSRKLGNQALAESDAAQLLDSATLELLQLRGSMGNNTIKQVGGVASANLTLLDRLSRSEVELPGISTGFYDLDRTLGGLQPGMKVEVAGRPGMGKSAFVLGIINQVAVEQGRAVAFFSLEMPATQQEMRLKCMRTQIPFHRLQKGHIYKNEWEPLYQETQRIAQAPLYIDDSGRLSSTDLRSKCLHLKHHADLQLVVVDYLQLMHHPGFDHRHRNKENEVAEISRSAKQLAQDLGIPVIEVSQLNRNAEQRSDKRPMLSDLRESGSIEQDADVVLFPFRPGYYNKDGQQADTDSSEAEIIIAKHRNGPCKTIPITYKEQTLTFR